MAGHRHGGLSRGSRGVCPGHRIPGGHQISAIEEIAYRNGWITKEKLEESAALYGKSPYGKHLHNVASGKYIY